MNNCRVCFVGLLLLQSVIAQYYTIIPPENCAGSCSGIASAISPDCVKCLVPTINEWQLPLDYIASYFLSFPDECGDGKFTFACMIKANRVKGSKAGFLSYGTNGLLGKVSSSIKQDIH